jgi:cytochrome o ubiquinol oxidase subunit 2
MMPPGRRGVRGWAPALALALGGCAGGPLDPHGPIASAQLLILLDALAIMLAIVIPTIGVALWFAWWYRASNTRAVYQPDFAYSGRIEIVVWAIPTLVILFLGGVIWIGSHDLDPARPIDPNSRPIEVQVVALDWKWLFILPAQGVASVNELVVPAGAPVHFLITSASVMNTFYVPQLAGMIYAMNGMVTQLHAKADHPGDYYGRSGQFSGDGFSDMYFTVHSVPHADFLKWVADARANGPALDRAAYGELVRPSQAVKPYTFKTVDPALFGDIATQRIPPAPGPDENRPHGAAQAAEK